MEDQAKECEELWAVGSQKQKKKAELTKRA